MNIFNLPIFGFNGKNYAFNRYLDCHQVSIKALLESKKWTLDETDTEILGRN